jgi:hypothetical protein
MRTMSFALVCTAAMTTMALPNCAQAAVASYTDATAWQSAVNGQFSTIDFQGFPHDTFITDQYSEQGIVFTGENLITGPTPLYENDQWGLFSPNGTRFFFDAPQNWIAIDYPGAIRFDLFNAGQLIYTSPFFQPGGVGNFAGLVSDSPFDEVYLYKSVPPSQNSIFIDDLHWGAPVPAPGVLTLLCIGALRSTRKRRS